VPEPPRNVFQYAIIRVVPSVERGETLNAGVVLLCRPRRYLGARIALDERRLAAIAPDLDPSAIRPHLDAIERVAAGDPAAGPIAALGQAERFHWLVAPASTIIQPSEVHTGLCDDPAAELEHLVATLAARQFDDQDGGRPAVPRVTSRFVAQRRQPVRPGVQLDGVALALHERSLPAQAEFGRAIDEGLDPLRRALVVLGVGQDELPGPLAPGGSGGRRLIIEEV
jgi:hypothetical protein